MANYSRDDIKNAKAKYEAAQIELDATKQILGTKKKITDQDRKNLELLIKKRNEQAKFVKDGEKALAVEKETTFSLKEQIGIGNTIIKQLGKKSSLTRGVLDSSVLIEKYSKRSSKVAKQIVKSLTGVHSTSQGYLDNVKAIGTEEFKQVDLTKQIADMKELAQGSKSKELTSQVRLLETLQAEQTKLAKIHDITESTAEQFLKPVKYLNGLLGQIPIVGGALSKMVPIDQWEKQIKSGVGDSLKEAAAKLKGMNTGMLGLASLGAVVLGVLTKMVMASVNFANETGLSYKQTLKLGGALAVNAEGVSALAKEFGNINDITTMMAVDMKILNKQYGISASSSAQILKLQTATSSMSKRQLLNVQKEVAQMARLEGVSPAAVFESMASDSEAFAKFAKDSGKNLAQAAIQAKKLGLEMSAMTGAAVTMLDLESSMTAQFQASVLLGRQINLDKARQFALSGNIAGLQSEIVKQVGGEAEWNKLNLIQRIALADAVGLQVSEVSKVVGAQNKVNNAIEEGSKKQWGAVATGAALGALLLGVIIAAISALSLGSLTGKSFGAAIKGGLAGMAVGAGVGAAAGGVYKATQGAAPKEISGATMNPGTVANVTRGEMTIHAGESTVRTDSFNLDPMVAEIKKLQSIMNSGFESLGVHSKNQVSAIKGIGVSSV